MNEQTPYSHPSGFLGQMEAFFERYLTQKAPFHLPPNVREWVVKYSPWIDLVLLILSLPLILAVFGISMVVLPFAAAVNPFGSLWTIIHWTIIVGAFVLQIMALPGLFKRSLRSWYLVYYSVLLGALGSLLNRDIFGLIIGTTISLYILFQIKEYYK